MAQGVLKLDRYPESFSVGGSSATTPPAGIGGPVHRKGPHFKRRNQAGRDLRLKWAVIGDVLMPDNDGDYVAGPDGGHGQDRYEHRHRWTTGLESEMPPA